MALPPDSSIERFRDCTMEDPRWRQQVVGNPYSEDWLHLNSAITSLPTDSFQGRSLRGRVTQQCDWMEPCPKRMRVSRDDYRPQVHLSNQERVYALCGRLQRALDDATSEDRMVRRSEIRVVTEAVHDLDAALEYYSYGSLPPSTNRQVRSAMIRAGAFLEEVSENVSLNCDPAYLLSTSDIIDRISHGLATFTSEHDDGEIFEPQDDIESLLHRIDFVIDTFDAYRGADKASLNELLDSLSARGDVLLEAFLHLRGEDLQALHTYLGERIRKLFALRKDSERPMVAKDFRQMIHLLDQIRYVVKVSADAAGHVDHTFFREVFKHEGPASLVAEHIPPSEWLSCWASVSINQRKDWLRRLNATDYKTRVSLADLSVTSLEQAKRVLFMLGPDLTTLDLSKTSLQKAEVLELIRYRPNLNMLILDHCSIQDEDLQTICEAQSALTILGLNHNQIGELEPLKSLTNLTVLGLYQNQISELEPLKSLTNLTVLGLYQNQISELEPLKSLTNLTALGLGQNQISKLEPLKSLTNLTVLRLGHNQISELEPLKSLTNLTLIMLDNNQISELEPLKSLTNLTILVLKQNQISELEPLKSLTNLTKLWLENNPINNLAPLDALTNLVDLRT